MFVPKKKNIKNKKHLIFVTGFDCCLNISHEWCKGHVQAHHLLKPYDGVRGMGMKAGDNNAIPLCQTHHALLHDTKGDEDKFWESYNLSPDFGRNIAKELWEMFQRKKYNKERLNAKNRFSI